MSSAEKAEQGEATPLVSKKTIDLSKNAPTLFNGEDKPKSDKPKKGVRKFFHKKANEKTWFCGLPLRLAIIACTLGLIVNFAGHFTTVFIKRDSDSVRQKIAFKVVCR